MPAVAAHGVVKTLGARRAARRVLDGVDLAVDAGELVAVVGPSGSGKSTLLHLLGALDLPDGGWVEIAGIRTGGRGERTLAELRRHHVGFVFQFFHLIPELSAEENVLLPTSLPGAPAAGPARARELIGRLGVAPVGDHLPHELSGGERQRFAIARALVNDPAVVLADEPTGNLDTAAGAIVLELLRAVADEGRAVVLATHDPGAAAAADRVLALADGRVLPPDSMGPARRA